MPEVVTVYWPSRCAGSGTDGFIVGWANGESTFAVAAVVPRDRLQQLCDQIRGVAAGDAFAALRRDCGGVPCILGLWGAAGAPARLTDDERQAVAGLFGDAICTHPWMTLVNGEGAGDSEGVRGAADLFLATARPAAVNKQQARPQLPCLSALSAHPACSACAPSPSASLSSGCDADAAAATADAPFGSSPTSAVNIILYTPPDPSGMGGFATRLRRVPGVHALGGTAVMRIPPANGLETLAAGAGYLCVPTRTAAGAGGGHSPSGQQTQLQPALSANAIAQLLLGRLTAQDCILNQLNAARFVADVLLALPAGATSETPAAAPPAPSTPVSLAASFKTRLLRVLLWPVAAFMLFCRCFCVALLSVIQARVPSSIPVIGGISLYERSTLARQVHLKMFELSTWPYTLRRLQRLHDELAARRVWKHADHVYAETAAWYDSVCRAALDLVVGVAACAILWYTPWAVRLVLTTIHSFGEILHIDVLRAWIDWLMGLPAGLKLNHFAGKKIGGAVLSFIDFWEYITTFLTPYEPIIVMTVGGVGLGGMSLLLAMASDVLELATLHLFTLYSQFAWLHNQQMSLLSSLWKLFRGKKLNVLRNRVDSNDYDVAQLLLGTLFFTVVTFLFPTTFVYYAFFLIVWLGILITRGVIWWLITGMNNVPLYALYCALAARHRLPSGVSIACIGAAAFDAVCVRHSCTAIMDASTPGVIDDTDALSMDTEGATVKRLSVPPALPLLTPAPAASAGSGAPAGAPTRQAPCTMWFTLQSQHGGVPVVLAPFSEAFSVVMQRYSVGTFLKTVIFGEQGMSLFRSIHATAVTSRPVGGGAVGGAQAAKAATGTGASGIALGYANVNANAPTEGPPVPTARKDKHAITERILEPPAAEVGTWRDYWTALTDVVHRVTVDGVPGVAPPASE